MRFLVDEDLPRSIGHLLERHGHGVEDVRDIGLRAAKDAAIADYAQRNGLAIVTADAGFANIHLYPPAQYRGIILVKAPVDATASFITDILEPFIRDENLLAVLPGKLAIVEPGRVRMR